ncbi:hypothetical protein XELAEV_18038432mg [Xenopus laevis]|uniref:Uncharacterized protein n=1 Tax=Xenopus laevis TaxID=8355 RepID=A0A974C5N7_XENLA|nr:hypothetical protein XELAEV_18038432mg [Xenopus laevis]
MMTPPVGWVPRPNSSQRLFKYHSRKRVGYASCWWEPLYLYRISNVNITKSHFFHPFFLDNPLGQLPVWPASLSPWPGTLPPWP